MNATASNNPESRTAPLFPAAEKVSEAVLILMQVFGLQSIKCRKIKSADYERIVADVTAFSGVPEEVSSAGILVKDDLARILAAVGTVELGITATADDVIQLLGGYKSMLDLARKNAETPAAEVENSSPEEKAEDGIRVSPEALREQIKPADAAEAAPEKPAEVVDRKVPEDPAPEMPKGSLKKDEAESSVET